MGSGGGGGGGGNDRNRGVERGRTRQPTKPKPAPKPKVTKPTSPPRGGGNDKPSKARSKPPAAEKMREVGVRYTPTSTPSGGLAIKADIRKTGPSGELARKRGPSPGDVLATVGTLPTVSADVAAANIAGRPDVNRDVLGDLAKRARVGQMPNMDVQLPGLGTVGMNILNVAGKKSAMNLLTGLATDQPTIKDGKVTYGKEIVTDPRGGVAGLVDKKTGIYSGRPDLDPTQPKLEKGSDPEPVITPEVTPEVVPDDTAEASTIVSRGKRRTRGKRSGLAGKDEEYGILVTT